jgi:hypothetical protein
MKRTVLTLVAASSLLAALPAVASAAPWQSINQRQANLDQRIDQGIRSGELNRREATRLRRQFHELGRLEAHYRMSGGRLTMAERADLDRRFDQLSNRIYNQKHDEQVRRY